MTLIYKSMQIVLVSCVEMPILQISGCVADIFFKTSIPIPQKIDLLLQRLVRYDFQILLAFRFL